MSSDLALSARGLGKAYTIVHNATDHVTMTEVALERLKHPFRRAEREQFWAVRDVDFDLHQGEVLGLIGRNGAGKSTLLKLLSRITAPTEGEIKLWGRVGSLLEVGTGFHPELTGRENIYLNGSILGMTTAEIRNQFDAIVDFAGVEKFLDTPVKRYSSGMFVRLAFSVAAHLETEILLVDEVLSVGDADFQKKCLGKMGEVATAGRTVILVSHNLSNIEDLCDRAVLLDGGEVAHDGDVSQAIHRYLERPAHRVVWSEPETRSGTGEIRVMSAAVVEDNVAVNDEKRVRFTLAALDGIGGRCFVAAHIRGEGGSTLAHLDSNTVGVWYDVSESGVEGEFALRIPWLHPGDYIVDLFVCNAGVMDFCEDAVTFAVRPGYPYSGSISESAALRDAVPPDYSFSVGRPNTPTSYDMETFAG